MSAVFFFIVMAVVFVSGYFAIDRFGKVLDSHYHVSRNPQIKKSVVHKAGTGRR